MYIEMKLPHYNKKQMPRARYILGEPLSILVTTITFPLAAHIESDQDLY